MPPEEQNQTDNQEEVLVSQIAAENAEERIDEDYIPEEPLQVIHQEKHKWLAKLKRPKFWLRLAVILFLTLVFAWLITPSRTWILNTLRVRANFTASVFVSVDDGAAPSLKNAKISVGGQEYVTGDDGSASIKLPYGTNHLTISKAGYQAQETDADLDFDPFFGLLGGWDDGLNQSFYLQNTGISLTFLARDWLTGKAVTSGSFAIGDVVASPSASGEVLLTIPATDDDVAELTAKFDSGYNNKTYIVSLVGSDDQELQLVSSGRHYFVSKQTDGLAVFGCDIDGSNLSEIVPGSKNETSDIAFAISGSGDYGVLASTREAEEDSSGRIQQKLYVVDIDTENLTAVDTAQSFKIVDWQGDTVVYIATYLNDSGVVTERLSSVNATTLTRTDLSNGTSYLYARVSSSSVVYLTTSEEVKTVKIGGGTEKILGTSVKNIVQPGADKFAFQIADSTWQQFDANSNLVSVASTPSSLKRAFLNIRSQDQQKQVIYDVLNSQASIISYNLAGSQETIVYQGDFTAPISWAGNNIVFRQGSADYVVAPDGSSSPKKITDVALTTQASSNYFSFY